MAKRGFFAEINYQAQQAEKRRLQQNAAAIRAHNAAVREAERAHKAAERAHAQAVRASEVERKAAEKEAARLHVEARLAEVEALNTELTSSYADIDSLLEWTLDIDDHVDLETLMIQPDHPAFDPGPLGQSVPLVQNLVYPPEPQYLSPPAPKGLFGKKKHAEQVEASRERHEKELADWNASNRRRYESHLALMAKREEKEAERLVKLAEAEAIYRAECEAREAEAAERNAELRTFINDLAFDVEYAITDYVGIVLSNSVYPDAFPVDYDHSFDLATRELTLSVSIPEPSGLPTAKEYRYVKAKDEITSTQLSAKAQKDRYTSATHQVAVRTLHEVFEADRAGKIHSVALTIGVNRTAPATGRPEFVPLVIVAADRETFNGFDLRNVVPSATLEHLGAAMSKNPYDLVPADTSRGVRQRGQ